MMVSGTRALGSACRVLLREWRHCCEDKEFATAIYWLVAHEPAYLSSGLLLGLVSSLTGVVIALAVYFGGFSRAFLGGNVDGEALALHLVLGGGLGMITGAMIWAVSGRRWCYEDILSWVSGTPEVLWRQFLSLLASVSLLACCGSLFALMIHDKLPEAISLVLFGGLNGLLTGVRVGARAGLMCGIAVCLPLSGLCGAVTSVVGFATYSLFDVGMVLPFTAQQSIGFVGCSFLSASLVSVSISSWKSRRSRLNAIDKCRQWYFWWYGRPSIAKLASAIALLSTCRSGPHTLEWRGIIEEVEKHVAAKVPSAEQLVRWLNDSDWRNRTIARFALALLGGSAVDSLVSGMAENSPRSVSWWVLYNICSETSRWLAKDARSLFCARCIVRCWAHTVRISGSSFRYFGCRACHQSRDFIKVSGKVIAVLDETLNSDRISFGENLIVNWLKYGQLFDFDYVVIGVVSDEVVERFCLQVKNDTDEMRRKKYPSIVCYILANAALKKQSINMLRASFGRTVIRTGLKTEIGGESDERV